MSNSSTGQVLGASTAIGGATFLPYAAGSPLVLTLSLIIRVSCSLVIISYLLRLVWQLYFRIIHKKMYA